MLNKAIKGLAAMTLAATLTTAANAHEGTIHVTSAHDVPTTVERLVKVVEEKGATVFARVDHAAGAKKVGMDLPPTVLVIFGNPAVGTPLMLSHRMKGLDLPMKVLVTEEDGKVTLNYHNPAKLCAEHANEAAQESCVKIAKALEAFTKTAATAD